MTPNDPSMTVASLIIEYDVDTATADKIGLEWEVSVRRGSLSETATGKTIREAFVKAFNQLDYTKSEIAPPKSFWTKVKEFFIG